MHRLFARALFLLAAVAARGEPRTVVTIEGAAFHINGRPTYEGRVFRGYPVEGLLLNARLVQGIFDDRNPQTRPRWAYPDTGRFDPERNTREFLAAMPEWRRHGLLSFTINLQGGSPEGYSQDQPWHNSAFEANEALASYASWGFFEGGRSDYATGYQCPPVNWTINTPLKRAFFERVREVAGGPER